MAKQLVPSSESSGDYRLRFRYELWSQAAQEFRSPVSRRFKSIAVNAAANAPNSSTGELDGGSGSDGVTELSQSALAKPVP